MEKLMAFKLVVANKRYSSWSMRPWLCLKVANVPFQEELVFLGQADTDARLRAFSPSGRVPALVELLEDGETSTVWESLAVCETIAERFPQACLWPRMLQARAHARSVAHEMHAGFNALRQSLPMNLGARHGSFPPVRSGDALQSSGETWPGLAAQGVEDDIARVLALWREARLNFGERAEGDDAGPFLYGRFSVADAMFAPVATRFRTYGVALDTGPLAYVRAVLNCPAFLEWEDQALAETERLEKYERF
jgi:glutathione S-transferase